jgi:hypothetical protein
VTPTLLFARRVIIQWVTFWVTPFEFTFDLIEAELNRRGVDLSNGCSGQQPVECALLCATFRVSAISAGFARCGRSSLFNVQLQERKNSLCAEATRAGACAPAVPGDFQGTDGGRQSN